MCLRYSNFSGFRMLAVRSPVRIMARTMRCLSCRLSILLLLGMGQGGLGGAALSQIFRLPDYPITSGIKAGRKPMLVFEFARE